MLALSNSSKYEIANLLLDNGADVNKYLYAEKIGSGEKVVMYTPMSVAFKNDKFDKQERKKLIMKIIDNGADVNISLMSGDSPLNWAVRESDPEIVRAMIKKGAKVSKGVLEDAEKVKTKPDGNEIYEMVKAASS
jgi:ankyrin repeat protein